METVTDTKSISMFMKLWVCTIFIIVISPFQLLEKRTLKKFHFLNVNYIIIIRMRRFIFIKMKKLMIIKLIIVIINLMERFLEILLN